MIEKMTRYDFILLSGETEDFLKQIQELGVVDIKRSVKAIDEKSAAMLAEADSLKKRIAMLESENFVQDSLYSEISENISLARKEAEAREPWGEFSREDICKLESLGCKVRFYCVSKKKFDESWAENYPLQVICDNGSTVWFVTASQAGADYNFPIAECAAPEGSTADANEQIAALSEQLFQRKEELMREKDMLPELKADYEKILAEADYYFACAAKSSAAENTLTLVTGFAPSENADSLKASFDGMGVFYICEKAVVDDDPPIKLRNNKFVSMFEVLTDMYGRPVYNGFDPTPYISIFFMLFFAMCMGDAGYGLILMILGLLLKKVPSFSKLAPLVVSLGGATVVVGLIFHTVFSVNIAALPFIQDSGLSRFMVPDKIAGYDGTMVVAIVVGIVHLCLAMIVKTVYATRNMGFVNSLSVWGWTLFLVGTVVVLAAGMALNIDAALTKWIIIGLGIVAAIGIFPLRNVHKNPLINIGGGLWETYNTATGVLGDVLSYLRLYALGLAGSMLGYAFNTLAVMARGDGGFGWVPFILIALIGHTLNIAMAALGAFVHPLRLNFLEFFKNSDYNGTGRSYNPLKK